MPSSACNIQRRLDRKSTRLNSSHSQISYAVFCLKKKIGIEPADDKPAVPGQIPPDDVAQHGQQSDDAAIERQGDGIVVVRAEDGCDERDEGNAHEEQDAQPDQGPVHPDDEVKGLMVREPEDAEDDEADYECPEAWNERPEAGRGVYARWLK